MPDTAKSAQSPKGGSHVDEPLNERRTIRDYYIILRERLWIALPLALLVSIGLGYYRARAEPLYQATATMRFEKPERVVIGPQVVDAGLAGEADLNTRLQEMGSREMRNRVLHSLTSDEIRILQRPFLKDLQPGQEPPPPAAALGSPNIQNIRASYLISISVTHRDPEAAALVANRYVDQFMRYLAEGRSGATYGAQTFLKERSDQLRMDAEEADKALYEYQRSNNLVSLENSTNIVQNRLMSSDTSLQASKLDRIRIEGLVNQVREYSEQGKNLLQISYLANHGNVPVLRSQLDGLIQDQSVLTERYLERHPKMIDVANKIAVAEQQLNAAVQLAISDLNTSLESAITNEAAFQREYDNSERQNIRLRDMRTEYNSLEQQSRIARENYARIFNRLSEVETDANLEEFPIRPLDRATAPGAPFTPHLPSIIRNSVFLFIAIFVGVAVGLTFLDDRVKSAWDVEHFLGVNLLGIVPDLSSLKDEEKYSLVMENRQAPGTESFLSIYSSVKIHSKLDFPKSILVTSTIPGEGKTLISCNLAGGFARHGRRTLLVDCDLRRPMLHRHFKEENDLGLIPWFENGGVLQGPLDTDPHLGVISVGSNLSLLRSGGRSRIPTEMLESTAFAELLDQAQKEFDLIIVDSPPLGAVTDSLLLAERTDEVVYVCRFNRAYRKHIRQYVKALHNGKNEFLGIVLNGLSPRRIEYYSNYRYYRSYKKYYGAEA